MKWNILIIGADISGSILAERYAAEGKRVLMLEKRNHIGGNCYDYINENGIRISKYGAHLFHTNDEDVWKNVNRFSEWFPWEHKVLARISNQQVPIPVNMNIVNKIFDLNLYTEQEMEFWLELNRIPYAYPQNGKEAVLSKIEPVLYEKLFKFYTKKQWDKYPEVLHASVLDRIPVRTNRDDRYFTDKYQALPKDGYTKVFENMLSSPLIDIQLNTNYFKVREVLPQFEKVFYTGPIDQFFDFKFSIKEALEYRSIRFEEETLPIKQFQNNSVINYPGPEVDFTRIIEYKHFGNQISDGTTIVREYSTSTGEPYYPVLNDRNLEIYNLYQREAERHPDIHFVGRLANYKYFNMDQAFKNALDLYQSLKLMPFQMKNNALRA